MKTVSQIIRELREDHDLKQTEVARILGIAQQTYSNYETGEYELPVRHLAALCRYYKVSSDYVIGLSDFKYPFSSLKENFSESERGVSMGQLFSQMTTLNTQGKRLLSEYVEFLLTKYADQK